MGPKNPKMAALKNFPRWRQKFFQGGGKKKIIPWQNFQDDPQKIFVKKKSRCKKYVILVL